MANNDAEKSEKNMPKKKTTDTTRTYNREQDRYVQYSGQLLAQ